MRGRAATYALGEGVGVVRGVMTGMPFLALVGAGFALVVGGAIVGEASQMGSSDSPAVRSTSQARPMTIARVDPAPITSGG